MNMYDHLRRKIGEKCLGCVLFSDGDCNGCKGFVKKCEEYIQKVDNNQVHDVQNAKKTSMY